MLTKDTVEQLVKQPVVMNELLANVSTEAFLEMFANAKVDEPHPLDNETIIEGLLARNDVGKLLVAARYCRFGDLWHKPEPLVAIAQMSLGHKCALLSNTRINWYSQRLSFLKEGKANSLIADSLLANDETTKAVLSNPRADRNLVAEAIRGADGFATLAPRIRHEYGLQAITAHYIDSPNYPGKDSPDTNELDFNKPNKAFLAVLKEVLSSADPKHRERISSDALTRLTGRWAGAISDYVKRDGFAMEPDDWLTPEDRAACEALDWNVRYGERTKRAAKHLIEWAAAFASPEPIAPSEDQKIYDFSGSVGSLAAYLTWCAVRLHDSATSFVGIKPMPNKRSPSPSPAPQSLADELATSQTWVTRAGAIAAKFEAQVSKEYQPEKRIALAKQFLDGQFKDPATTVRGLSVCRFFWGIRNSSDEIGSAFQMLSRHSPEAERDFSYVWDWLGRHQFDEERDEVIDRHNRMTEAADFQPRDLPLDDAAAATQQLGRQVAALAAHLKSLQSWIFWGGLIIGALILLRH